MVGLLAKGIKVIGTKVLISLFSEKMLEWVFWKVAKLIVASTKTPHDDAFLVELEKAYKS